MYKIKKIAGKTVFYSDIAPFEHFFSSREIPLKDNKENQEKVAKYLNIKKENLICPNQTHSDNVEFLTEEKKSYPNCDALILDIKDYAIFLNFADCTPLIFYDLKYKIGAIAHAGWRGTVLKIGPKTFLKMKEKYNSNPKDIVALIGPCISFKHFETYLEALFALKNSVQNQEGLFFENYADLKGINKRQLEELGIEKIDVCPYCTIEDNDKFFSYRKENKTSFRHSAVLKL